LRSAAYCCRRDRRLRRRSVRGKPTERKGGAPTYRRIPPKTRPNARLTKTPTAGKQDRININATLALTIATRQSTTGQAPSLVPRECASPTTTLCCIERFAVLGSASDHLRPPDSELTPNIIVPNLTEHYVSPLVLKDREHKSGSHVPNIFFSLKGEELSVPPRPGTRQRVGDGGAPHPTSAASPRPGACAAGQRRVAWSLLSRPAWVARSGGAPGPGAFPRSPRRPTTLMSDHFG